jgi:hypothetical protein
MTRDARRIPEETNSVPFATFGDFAGQGDVRNPLHHKPVPHRGGVDGRQLLGHRSPTSEEFEAGYLGAVDRERSTFPRPSG